MSTNSNVLFDATYSILDTTVSPNVYAVNRLRDLLLANVSAFYNPFYQVGLSLAAIPLPVAIAQVVMIINLSTTSSVGLYLTPNGGSESSTIVLQPALNAGQPGGCFLYMSPSIAPLVGSVGGFTQIRMVSSIAATPVEVLVAG